MGGKLGNEADGGLAIPWRQGAIPPPSCPKPDTPGVASRRMALSGNLRGACWLSLAMLVLVAETVLLRFVDPALPTVVYTLARAAAQLALGAALVLSLGIGWRGAATRRPWLQLFRGASSLVSWQLYYLSFRLLDFAVATTLNFASALFVVLFAGPVMGERVGAARWAATLLGFAGVVVVVRPGGGADPLGVAAGLGSAVCGMAIVFANRALGLVDRVETTMFWVGVVAVAGALPLAIMHWSLPSAADLALVALAASTGALALWLILIAFRSGEASALAPILNLRLVFAAAAGWAFFGEWPDGWAALGGIAILYSALLLARAEARRAG